jgi:hypothetical protein
MNHGKVSLDKLTPSPEAKFGSMAKALSKHTMSRPFRVATLGKMKCRLISVSSE